MSNNAFDFSAFEAETGLKQGGGKNASLYRPELFRDSNGIKFEKSHIRKIRAKYRDELANLLRMFSGLKSAKSKNLNAFLDTFLKYYKATYVVNDFSVKSITNSTETAANKVVADLLTAAQAQNAKSKIIA